MKKLPQLFLFHFAGGNIYSYNFLIPILSPYFKVHTIELPGRGKRIKEPFIRDCMLACNDLYGQLTSKLTSPDYLIYGHSMGAMLAFLVTAKMEQEMRPPVHLIVTGNDGSRHSKERYCYNTPTELFIQELKQLGGVSNEFFENEELFKFYEPILRADFEISEKKHELLMNYKIKTPIYALMGTEEKGAEYISNWKSYTSGAYQEKLLVGDHFFIYQHPNELATIIRNCYKQNQMLQY